MTILILLLKVALATLALIMALRAGSEEGNRTEKTKLALLFIIAASSLF